MAENVEEQEEQEMAAELAEVQTPTAEVLAGIVGDEFGIEMISPWGDRWIWVKVPAEVSQEIYKVLGEPLRFERVGEPDEPVEN